MKNTFTLILILIYTTSFAQNESVYLSFGKPWFPDKNSNLNNYSIGINYQNRFSSSFAFGFKLEYVQSNDLPNFYDDDLKLKEYLMDQKFDAILFNSQWSKVSSFNLGTNVNYLFVNNKKFMFSFNFGIGYMFSNSSSHYVENWTYNQDTGNILSYTNSKVTDTLNTFYYTLGLQFQYTFYKEYFIGINPYYLMPIGEKKINTIPVYPNYYNLTLNIGKKF